MPQPETTLDYYAIVGISNTATFDEIKKSYRSLAKDLHPDKNPGNSNATANFQSLGQAYETLKDSELRRSYDILWPRIHENCQAEQNRRVAEEASRRQAAAADQIRRDSEEAAKRQGARDTERKQEAEERRQRELKVKVSQMNRYNDDIFETNRRIKRLSIEITRLQALDDEELKRERERNGWGTYFLRFLYSTPQETDDERQKREVERLHRLATRTIKENDLIREEKLLQNLMNSLRKTRKEMDDIYEHQLEERRELEANARTAEAKRQSDIARKIEQARRTEQARVQAEKVKARAEWAKKTAEANRLAKVRREKEAREGATAEELLLKAELRRREEFAKKAEEARKEFGEQMRRAAQQQAQQRHHTSRNTPTASKRTTCQHQKFWPKVSGAATCENCHQYHPNFLFKCPECGILACANCRQNFRSEGRKGRGQNTHV